MPYSQRGKTRPKQVSVVELETYVQYIVHRRRETRLDRDDQPPGPGDDPRTVEDVVRSHAR